MWGFDLIPTNQSVRPALLTLATVLASRAIGRVMAAVAAGRRSSRSSASIPSATVKRLHARFRAEGIVIPFPIRTIHAAPRRPFSTAVTAAPGA